MYLGTLNVKEIYLQYIVGPVKFQAVFEVLFNYHILSYSSYFSVFDENSVFVVDFSSSLA